MKKEILKTKDKEPKKKKEIDLISGLETADTAYKVLKKIMLEVFPETTKLWQEVYWDSED